MFEQPRFSYPVLALLLLMPQGLFVVGEFMAWGIRFPFLRWQDSAFGPSVIPLNRELTYILNGTVGGRTAFASGVWLAGVILLVAAAALVVAWQSFGIAGLASYPGPLVALTGVFFLAWAMVQYGPLLSGPSGFGIPFGVPLLWYCGWQFTKDGKEAVVPG